MGVASSVTDENSKGFVDEGVDRNFLRSLGGFPESLLDAEAVLALPRWWLAWPSGVFRRT